MTSYFKQYRSVFFSFKIKLYRNIINDGFTKYTYVHLKILYISPSTLAHKKNETNKILSQTF